MTTLEISDDFIKSEMLAEKFIIDVGKAKSLLVQENIEQCLALLQRLETDMHVTLAVGERMDMESKRVTHSMHTTH